MKTLFSITAAIPLLLLAVGCDEKSDLDKPDQQANGGDPGTPEQPPVAPGNPPPGQQREDETPDEEPGAPSGVPPAAPGTPPSGAPGTPPPSTSDAPHHDRDGSETSFGEESPVTPEEQPNHHERPVTDSGTLPPVTPGVPPGTPPQTRPGVPPGTPPPGAGVPPGSTGRPPGVPGAGVPGFPGVAPGTPGPDEAPQTEEGRGTLPGGEIGGTGQPQGQSFEAGSPEAVAQQFLSRVQQKNYNGMESLVSEKATGSIADTRNGKVSQRSETQLKFLLTGARFHKDRALEFGGYKIAVLINNRKQIVHLRMRKDAEGYRIYDIDVPRPSTSYRSSGGGVRGGGIRGRGRGRGGVRRRR